MLKHQKKSFGEDDAMRSSRKSYSLRHNPFKDLEKLRGSLSPVPYFPESEKSPKDHGTSADRESEALLFEQAMKSVMPTDRAGVIVDRPRVHGAGSPPPDREDGEVLKRLQDLLDHGEGFTVSHTPEYMEGTLYTYPRGITERLHNGDFSVQDHIDLHGLTSEEAGQALEDFFSRSLERGKHMLLIIHGRGKSSPVRPVLKSLVKEWLVAGPFRTWVIAFTSARLCDGGAGATYVLLRHRPLTKRHKKGERRTMS